MQAFPKAVPGGLLPIFGPNRLLLAPLFTPAAWRHQASFPGLVVRLKPLGLHSGKDVLTETGVPKKNYRQGPVQRASGRMRPDLGLGECEWFPTQRLMDPQTATCLRSQTLAVRVKTLAMRVQ